MSQRQTCSITATFGIGEEGETKREMWSGENEVNETSPSQSSPLTSSLSYSHLFLLMLMLMALSLLMLMLMSLSLLVFVVTTIGLNVVDLTSLDCNNRYCVASLSPLLLKTSVWLLILPLPLSLFLTLVRLPQQLSISPTPSTWTLPTLPLTFLNNNWLQWTPIPLALHTPFTPAPNHSWPWHPHNHLSNTPTTHGITTIHSNNNDEDRGVREQEREESGSRRWWDGENSSINMFSASERKVEFEEGGEEEDDGDDEDKDTGKRDRERGRRRDSTTANQAFNTITTTPITTTPSDTTSPPTTSATTTR